MANDGFLMKNAAGEGGNYAPESMIEAVPLTQMGSTAEFVEVRAPSALGPGYELTVNVLGGLCVVLVPESGVQEGDVFRAQVIRKCEAAMGNNNDINHADTANNNNPHSIPSGRWRDGLCDCCTLGCCHTHACMAYWCCACTLGQIMTRMNLTWLARPHVTHTPKWSTFRIFFLAFAIFLTFSYSVILATFPSVDANGVVAVKPGDQFWKTLSNVASLSWCIFMLVTLCKTRAHVRRTYGIPETTCRGCEDCCCAYWCGCCTVAQMARHTVDYRQYEAGCCTSTGMRPDAPATCPYNV